MVRFEEVIIKCGGFRKKVYSTLLENPVIKRHHDKYINDRYAPAWKTLEFMTLGNLTALYQAIKDSEVKKKIATEYGCSLKVFVNYLETIRVIRNKCATAVVYTTWSWLKASRRYLQELNPQIDTTLRECLML